MVKRIKHNDLTHYFLRDHEELPRAYLASCRKFLNSIQDRLITKKDAAYLYKQQAASNKRQATSLTDHESRTIKDLERNKL